MDCLDCHNRVAHRFLTPEVAVDEALRTGAIDPSIPSIKKVAVDALAVRHEDPEEGVAAIRQRVKRYYREHFEGKVLAREPSLGRAIEELQRIYRRNVFAAMNVDGHSYPDHASHRSAPGCFRCHGGKHASDDGQVLAADCGLCHQFYHRSPEDGSLLRTPADASSLHPFRHEEHTKVTCWTCHAGTASPYAACSECHTEAVGSHGMRFECSICHRPGAPEVKDDTCARCHPIGESPLHAHKDHGQCLSCHDAHGWNVEYRKACAACHEKLGKDSWETHHPGEACSPCHDFRGVGFHMMGLPVGR